MQEKDTIYWQDHRGVIRSTPVKEYAHNAGSRTIINERMGIITSGNEGIIRTFPEDGRTGKREATTGENSGQPVPQTGGKSETKTDTPDTLPSGTEKKVARQTENSVISGRSFGTQH